MNMKRILLTTALAAFCTSGALAEDLSVAKDQSKVIKLTGAASTVVVGNPAIADVTMQDANTAFVTGKGFGTTNVIAMDADGRQIASFRIVVTSSSDRSVTLIKGQQQITLSCAPRCEQTAATGGTATP
jgi:Flp pilus assembly secretin CpaC